MHRPILAAAFVSSILATLAPANADADWRSHAHRHYFLVNGYDYREVGPPQFASYRSSCMRLEIKEYAALLRINYICEL